MKFEITIEGPLHSIARVCEKLEIFSPELESRENDRGSLKIAETEKGVDDCLLLVSRALRGFRGLEFRVRNLAYSEPAVVSFDRAFRPIGSLLIQPWNPSLPEIMDGCTIIIDQQHAFGSGLHPTTILCLKALDDMCRSKYPLRWKEILDFGCGTGLLAIAAVKWGARRAFGVEIDPASVLTARRNVGLNRVDEKVIILEGSWDTVDRTFDTITANLVSSVIYRTGEKIASYLKPEGKAIVSGFSEKQMEQIEIFFESTGLFPQKRTTLKGWGALTLCRRKREMGRAKEFN